MVGCQYEESRSPSSAVLTTPPHLQPPALLLTCIRAEMKCPRVAAGSRGPMLLLLLLVVAGVCVDSYKPVIIVHGIFDGPQQFQNLSRSIKKVGPRTACDISAAEQQGSKTAPNALEPLYLPQELKVVYYSCLWWCLYFDVFCANLYVHKDSRAC